MIRALPVLLFLVTACGSRDRAPAPLDLQRLASSWSAGRADPSCDNRGPRGEYLGPDPGAEYCQWPILRVGEVWSRVTGHRDGVFGLTWITWERVVRDSAQLRVVVDSIGSALTATGLETYECPDNARRWQRDGFSAQLAYLPPDRLGRPQFMLVATILPNTNPQFLCPAAPRMNPKLPRVRRSRST